MHCSPSFGGYKRPFLHESCRWNCMMKWKDHKTKCNRKNNASAVEPTNRPLIGKFCVFPEVQQAWIPFYQCLSMWPLLSAPTLIAHGCPTVVFVRWRDIPLSPSLHSSSLPVLPVISVAAGDIWTTVTVDTVGWRALTNPSGPQKTGGEDSHWRW